MLKVWKLTECCKSNKNKVQQVPDVAGKCEAMKESRLKAAAQPHGNAETSRDSEMPLLGGASGSQVITACKSIGSTEIQVGFTLIDLFLGITASILLNLITSADTKPSS